MKRIIALILVLCMTAGMIVSVSADSPFAKKLNLVRLIRTMFASGEDAPEFGELDDGKLIIYVAENGKKDAKGTEKAPLDSISTAREVIRGIDKSDDYDNDKISEILSDLESTAAPDDTAEETYETEETNG